MSQDPSDVRPVEERVPKSATRMRALTTAALLAALLCVTAYLVIPLQPVPVTLQVLIVVLVALLLPPRAAAAAVAVYLALGAVGIPVFAGGQGGIGVLAGPTGGYLSGFLVAAVVASAVRGAVSRVANGSAMADLASAVVAIAAVYAVGTTQLAIVTGLGVREAIAAGALPFIVPDAIKAAVAVGVARAVRRALER